jgi:hypothetical protein
LYICATSSTPLAAALLAAGFSPGAMLVFMMVGPATNIASLAVVAKILKGWAMLRYLLAIVVVSVLFGLLVDHLYNWLGMNAHYRTDDAHHSANWWHTASAAIASALILYWTARKLWRQLAR